MNGNVEEASAVAIVIGVVGEVDNVGVVGEVELACVVSNAAEVLSVISVNIGAGVEETLGSEIGAEAVVSKFPEVAAGDVGDENTRLDVGDDNSTSDVVSRAGVDAAISVVDDVGDE